MSEHAELIEAGRLLDAYAAAVDASHLAHAHWEYCTVKASKRRTAEAWAEYMEAREALTIAREAYETAWAKVVMQKSQERVKCS